MSRRRNLRDDAESIILAVVVAALAIVSFLLGAFIACAVVAGVLEPYWLITSTIAGIGAGWEAWCAYDIARDIWEDWA